MLTIDTIHSVQLTTATITS